MKFRKLRIGNEFQTERTAGDLWMLVTRGIEMGKWRTSIPKLAELAIAVSGQ